MGAIRCACDIHRHTHTHTWTLTRTHVYACSHVTHDQQQSRSGLHPSPCALGPALLLPSSWALVKARRARSQTRPTPPPVGWWVAARHLVDLEPCLFIDPYPIHLPLLLLLLSYSHLRGGLDRPGQGPQAPAGGGRGARAQPPAAVCLPGSRLRQLARCGGSGSGGHAPEHRPRCCTTHLW